MIGILRSILPFGVRNFLYLKKQRLTFSNYQKTILDYYRQNPSMVVDESMKEALAFLSSNPFSSLPYPFSKNYSEKTVDVGFDPGKEMHYCMLEGKRLYFKKGLEVQKIKRQFKNLLLEQDPQSAHRYITPDFEIQQGDVVIDAGAAEGNFSLSNIDRIKKLILIETDPAWIEALQATFEPFSEKVIILNKFVSSHNSDKTITIDRIVEQEGPVDFIKIDVDGGESSLLAGSQNTLNHGKAPKIAICTYHFEGDPEKFDALLREKGFQTVFSKGYMIFISQKGLEFPYLRKTLLKAWK